MKTEIIWNQIFERGMEHLIFHGNNNLITADSTAIGTINNIPYRIKYFISLDKNWITKRIEVFDLISRKEVNLWKNEDGNWIDKNNIIAENLNGCTDVDIMITPFTNTIPVKRLKMQEGESNEITVLYIKIPELDVSKAMQRYTCLGISKEIIKYKYESLSTGFVSEIEFDADGFVTDYPNIFKLIWKVV